ncbi:Asp-tRNA(Asn)/Glu-tRNA(Gln) amidotransferase subunit GatA [Alphaproteobacteria bacterium]|nr:Asp-tRNA(Asn)/Glu-tRNA(Gln) amidotransferase subunit GatA [Alphaproteobacteria bacterium]MDC3149529.1 Asp-tRNA(Asn)/Glu-tRNA(Gln) amidotransferase subunit GatA [Alphaproteobacteria bacterium]
MKSSISQIKDSLRDKKISVEELYDEFLIKAKSSKTNSFNLLLDKENNILSIKESQKRYENGNPLPLDGIPLGIKDLFCTKGIRTTASSKILSNFTPNYESFVTQKLLDDGSIFIGKNNCDEFAMGSSNETSFFGPVKNPWKNKNVPTDDLVPGGSSGGSAAAVAEGTCVASMGTDTGGSIRQPASLCGIVGLKPTFGSCSRWGIVAFASSLDQAGPLTNSVEDAALILNSINKHDFNDTTSSNHVREDYSIGINDKLDQKIKIGIPSDYLKDVSGDILSQIENTKKALIKHNVEFVDVEFKTTEYALSTYYILAPAEASSNLARYDGIRYGVREDGKSLDDIYLNSRTKGFGDEVTRRILIGAYVLSAGYYDAYYRQAQKVRRLIKDDFQRIFNDVDFILTPTTPNEAFKIGDKLDPISMYKNDIYTVPTSLAGLPGISIPSGLSTNGLPLGIQFIGNYFEEKKLLQIAALAEKELNFNEQ